MKFLKALSVIGIISLTACSSQHGSQTLYYWGNYSDVVYDYYNEQSDFAQQEEAVNQIIREAKAKNKPIAPGIYGHLGLLLLKQGKQTEAQLALQEEMRLHPESSTFIQYLQSKKK